jgi:hydrogenase expression/formation protein HypE
LAGQTGLGVMLEEADLPVKSEVAAVCDILGFDPLYLANEGKMIAIVETKDSEKALAALRRHPQGADARVVGWMVDRPAGQVGLRTLLGGVRLLDMPLGDQLPRIC